MKNNKYTIQLRLVGWTLTVLGCVLLAFLIMQFGKAQLILTRLKDFSSHPIEPERMAARLSELIRIMMHVFMPTLSVVLLASGLTILNVMKRKNKNGEPGH